MNKKRLGFLSLYGFGRGQCYVTLCYAKMLIDNYDIYILKQGNNPIAEEFKTIDVNITEHPSYFVKPEVFKEWITKNKLDAIVFNEYNQWESDGNNLVKLANDLGVKTYGYLVWEKFGRVDDYKDYSRLLAQTRSFERFFRVNRIRNFSYVPYSIDLKEFPKQERNKNEKFTFFHPGGFGGYLNRKNTWAVIEAFESLDKADECNLIITSQKPLQFNREVHPNIEIINKDLSRKELIGLYYKADAIVLPSKWETVGLPILESLASGTPVITSNIPPMNEFIKEGLNGYLCTPTITRYQGVSVSVAEVDPVEIKKKMENIMANELLYEVLCKNSRKIVEDLYDAEKNKKYFLEMLNEQKI